MSDALSRASSANRLNGGLYLDGYATRAVIEGPIRLLNEPLGARSCL